MVICVVSCGKVGQDVRWHMRVEYFGVTAYMADYSRSLSENEMPQPHPASAFGLPVMTKARLISSIV